MTADTSDAGASRPDLAPSARGTILHLSCEPGLYAAGGFPAPHAEWESLRDCAPAAEKLCELFGPFGYRRPLPAGRVTAPAGFASELARRYAIFDGTDRGPACGLYALEDVVLRDNVVYLAGSRCGAVLFETHRPPDRAFVKLGAPAEIAGAPAFAADGPCLLLSSSGSFNYGHWLVDDLPRIAALGEIRRRHPGEPITLLVTAHELFIDEVRRQSIEVALGPDSNVRIAFIGRHETWRFARLHYVSPLSLHPILKSPEALRGLRRLIRARTARRRLRTARIRLVESLRAGRWPGRRRLFVERAPTRDRPLVNGDAVFAALEPLGFERVVLDFDGFANQAALFADAAIVVGNMGASMTNTLFCRRGTPLVYLAPEGWLEPFFWDLAAVMGHRYHALYGPSTGDPFKAPFRIDPSEAARIAASLLPGWPTPGAPFRPRRA